MKPDTRELRLMNLIKDMHEIKHKHIKTEYKRPEMLSIILTRFINTYRVISRDDTGRFFVNKKEIYNILEDPVNRKLYDFMKGY